MLLRTAILLFFCGAAGAVVEPRHHLQTYQHADPNTGRVLECARCPPGTFLRAPCRDDTGKSDCAPCPTGSFTEYWNYIPKCLRCGTCGGSQVVQRECSASRDCQCTCREGYFYNARIEDCTRFTKCPTGFGVVRAGTPERDSGCEECPSGFFSQNVSATAPCAPHSACRAAGQRVVLKGRSWHDVVCATCDQLTSRDASEFLREILPSFVAHHRIPVKKMRRFLLRNPAAGSSRSSVMRLHERELLQRLDGWVRAASGQEIRGLARSLRRAGVMNGAEKLRWKLESVEKLVELCTSRPGDLSIPERLISPEESISSEESST